jgi:transcriptional regulator with XRE-family HTH domain
LLLSGFAGVVAIDIRTYDIMLYMSKFVEKLKAREMRRKGKSLLEISRKLNVSKSTVSKWCEDIMLSEIQVTTLLNNRNELLTRGRMMGAMVNKKKKQGVISRANTFGEKVIKKISKKELVLIATALYWAEGSKSESTSRFMFINSDPDMILLMKKFLISTMDVPPEDIVCSVQINKIHEERIDVVLNFWKNLLILPEEQMRKPYFVNTKATKVYENYNNYFGVCRLIVSKSSQLKYKMNGLIKALKRETLSA